MLTLIGFTNFETNNGKHLSIKAVFSYLYSARGHQNVSQFIENGVIRSSKIYNSEAPAIWKFQGRHPSHSRRVLSKLTLFSF